MWNGPNNAFKYFHQLQAEFDLDQKWFYQYFKIQHPLHSYKSTQISFTAYHISP